MHLVLRSTLARGLLSFTRNGNRQLIDRLITKHAANSGVEVLARGNAGNHLHLRVRVTKKSDYYHFIRALAGEIALKFKKMATISTARNDLAPKRSFWDQRPFSSIVSTSKYAEKLTDYIKMNQVEGSGFSREIARIAIEKWRLGIWLEYEDDPIAAF